AGLAFSSASLFPGWIAVLPVLGTVAVIAAGSSGGRWAPAWWLSLAPMRFIGDVSYSVYLWHWPLIIVWPYVTGVGLRTRDKLAIVVATVLLAWASKAWVEDPARVRPLLAAAPWRSYAFAVVGMSVVVAGAAGVLAEVDRRADAAAVQRAAAIASDCYGPHALDPGSGCEPPEGNGELIPPPEVVAMQNQEPLYPGCQAGITSTALRTCELGVPRLGAERVVALVGDSHATQWFPAFDQLGQELGWHVVTYAKSSCPFTQAQRVLESEQTDEAMLSCVAWRDGVREQLLADEDISYVFTAAFSSAYGFTDSVDDPVSDPGTDGFEAIWADLVADGHEVFALSRLRGTAVSRGGARHGRPGRPPDQPDPTVLRRRDVLPGGR
ncbi:MAG TPA: acyltransferase family protein, partial [Coriobacteriia bacterium]|nr:acyltransferase family protein [Coriobacteriia bacterium]